MGPRPRSWLQGLHAELREVLEGKALTPVHGKVSKDGLGFRV